MGDHECPRGEPPAKWLEFSRNKNENVSWTNFGLREWECKRQSLRYRGQCLISVCCCCDKNTLEKQFKEGWICLSCRMGLWSILRRKKQQQVLQQQVTLHDSQEVDSNEQIQLFFPLFIYTVPCPNWGIMPPKVGWVFPPHTSSEALIQVILEITWKLTLTITATAFQEIKSHMMTDFEWSCEAQDDHSCCCGHPK